MRTEAGKALHDALASVGQQQDGLILAVEDEAGAALDALRSRDWDTVMLDALCGSDNGNNPFYSDDDDTISLAHELGEAVRFFLAVTA